AATIPTHGPLARRSRAPCVVHGRSLRIEIDTIIKAAMDMDASDIHIIAGHPPMVRIHTVMAEMDYPVVTPEASHRILQHIASEPQLLQFKKIKDVDFSYELP